MKHFTIYIINQQQKIEEMKNSIDPAPESHSVNETEQNINAQETKNSNNVVMKEKNAVQVSTPNDIPTALDANEQANAGSCPATPATWNVSVIPIGVDSRRIYTMDELLSMGFKKARLRINRDINDRDVKKKMKSIKRCLGIISPIMMVGAKACLEQDLDVDDDVNGKSLSPDDPDIDMYIVTIDGQHREEAVARLNRELKPNEVPYSIPVIFPQVPNANILTTLGESNIATRPWKGIDHLTSLLNGRNTPGVNADVNETLEIVYKYAKDGCSEIAAWGYATGTYKRQPTATRLYNAQTDVKTRNDLTAGSNKYGRTIYKTLQTAKFEQKIIGSKEVAKWFIEKLHELVSDGTKTLEDAAETLKGFIDNLTTGEVTAINHSSGRTDEINGAQHKFSRYDVACETINKLFKDYKVKE